MVLCVKNTYLTIKRSEFCLNIKVGPLWNIWNVSSCHGPHGWQVLLRLKWGGKLRKRPHPKLENREGETPPPHRKIYRNLSPLLWKVSYKPFLTPSCIYVISIILCSLEQHSLCRQRIYLSCSWEGGGKETSAPPSLTTILTRYDTNTFQ